MRIDLHMHTTASDGLLAPADLVRAVQAANLQVFGVTDHDTVDGLAEAQAHGQAVGLTLVPGIELSAIWQEVEFHVLGHFVHPTDPALLAFLEARRAARRSRLYTMLSRLRAIGITVDAHEVLAQARDGNVGRPHLARVLVQRGFVGTTDEAFDRYLGTGKPAYVPRPDVTVQDAIRTIRQAGGMASLAHPGLYNRDEAIPELVSAGLDAIEVYHVNHSPRVTAHYRRLAGRLGLLVTGGSDFHGVAGGGHSPVPGMPCLPEMDFHRLQAAAKARRAAPRGTP
jgi:predicted metal-dependent phosphoesterase TrpH